MHPSSLNHQYRLGWSDATQSFVAVAENTKGRGKQSRSGRAARLVSALMVSGALSTAAAGDLPTGGQIVGGAGSISQSGQVMTISAIYALIAQGGDYRIDATGCVLQTTSATLQANGSTAVVWSDSKTLFGGHIAAKGDALGGNGGQVGISSKDKLSFGGLADASAPNGSHGHLLLDPPNIEIVDSLASLGLLFFTDLTPSTQENFGSAGLVVELRNNGVHADRIVVASPTDDIGARYAGAVSL